MSEIEELIPQSLLLFDINHFASKNWLEKNCDKNRQKIDKKCDKIRFNYKKKKIFFFLNRPSNPIQSIEFFCLNHQFYL